MNIVLFEPEETGRPLPIDDRRAVHVLRVLRRLPGEPFDAGIINGPRGKAVIESQDSAFLHLSFEWGEVAPPLEPITLVLGLPRPQTVRKVLEEATALGVQAIHFVQSDRGERGYSQSTLWSSGEWRRHMIAGAEQAFSTRLPHVTWGSSLGDTLAIGPRSGSRIALDNYESPGRFGELAINPPVTIVVGSERGWSQRERQLLREGGFGFAHLGERVLRVETACVAAIAVARSALGFT